MPLLIISAPGDHRDDFSEVVRQFNDWERKDHPRVRSLNHCVTPLPEARDSGKYMLTLVVHYELPAGG